MDADQAREFLVDWMRANFPTDRTFATYINKRLAGDFAWQLATALKSAAPAIAPTVASDTVLQDALLEIDEMACTGLLPRRTPAEMRMLFKQIINEVRPALLASRAAAPATGAAK